MTREAAENRPQRHTSLLICVTALEDLHAKCMTRRFGGYRLLAAACADRPLTMVLCLRARMRSLVGEG